jgi:hypothetical protein
MLYCKSLIICVLCLLISACASYEQKPNIDNVKDEVRILRFEKDLFNTDFDKVEDSIVFFKKKYGEFFDLFNYKIVKIGDCNNPSYPAFLKGFLTDYNINKLKQTVDSAFLDFSVTENELRIMFRYFKYYFPEKNVPVIITYFSGFNQSVVTTDTIIGIGLDKYLGNNSNYYARLGLPIYMRNNMVPYRISYDVAKAWAITQFPMSDSVMNLLSEMVYQGKVVFFVKSLIPNCSDSLAMTLSGDQLEWCKANEKQMWTYLVENKILFKTDFQIIKKFTEEAPFTKDFGRNSPGRAVLWCGFQIVKDYMDNKKGATLKELMAENNFQNILQISKYKP